MSKKKKKKKKQERERDFFFFLGLFFFREGIFGIIFFFGGDFWDYFFSGRGYFWDYFFSERVFLLGAVVGEVMKERRRERERGWINLSTCGCVIQLYLWENTQFIEIREFGWGFLMLTS